MTLVVGAANVRIYAFTCCGVAQVFGTRVAVVAKIGIFSALSGVRVAEANTTFLRWAANLNRNIFTISCRRVAPVFGTRIEVVAFWCFHTLSSDRVAVANLTFVRGVANLCKCVNTITCRRVAAAFGTSTVALARRWKIQTCSCGIIADAINAFAVSVANLWGMHTISCQRVAAVFGTRVTIVAFCSFQTSSIHRVASANYTFVGAAANLRRCVRTLSGDKIAAVLSARVAIVAFSCFHTLSRAKVAAANLTFLRGTANLYRCVYTTCLRVTTVFGTRIVVQAIYWKIHAFS